MSRELHTFPGGLQMPTYKALSDQEMSILQPIPERLFLPLQQHIGIASEPTVKIGDKVLKGQIIARANGYVSVPMHASTSGKIVDIGDYPVPHPSELKAPCIVIEADGEDRLFDIKPTHEYHSVDPKLLQELIKECGIIGLGGAGFPAHVKLNEGVENSVDTLIINGVECEPYITCDDRLIQEKANYIVAGTRMIRHAVQAKHCVIAVEDDMPAAYAELEKLIDDDIELLKIPTRYPAGGEKQLIQVLTGMEVPSGGLPIHVGVVIHNVATAAAVYRAVTRGEPVISRYVTVTGMVDKPRNLQVLLGTRVKDCIEACNFDVDENCQMILGGPMMGMHVSNPHVPVIKTTNCILVQENTPRPPEMPCIRCGYCADVCPVKLLPQQLYWHAKTDNMEASQQYHIFDCIECGCCSYVCPSNIPLVQYYRYSKSKIAAEERRRDGADHAHVRFLKRNSRLGKKLENKKQEQQVLGNTDSTENKQDYIAAALERTRLKREESKTQSRKPSTNDKDA
ncbi:MAG: electron transport complex subunit RsxC [Gammaproteobacteria bacterium]|nr:electron transport complex subunit RsxC [Gammaproteobacteria bacterium]